MDERVAEARNEEQAIARQDKIVSWLDEPAELDPAALAQQAAVLEAQANAAPSDANLREAANDARTKANLAARIASRDPGKPVTQGLLNGELLLEWLKSRGQANEAGDEVLWIFSALNDDLDAALEHFSIE